MHTLNIEEKARNEGISIGKAQLESAVGIGIGETEKRNVVSMLKDGSLPVNKIAKFSGLSEDEVLTLKKSLNC